jgi:serine O-acetyltransferase
MTLAQTLRLIRSDLNARLRYEGRTPSLLAALGAFFNPASMASVIWRFQTLIHRKRIPVLNKFLALANLMCFAAELEPEAEVAEGFLLLNPVGVMLHGHTKIGRNCIFAHQITTTLGPRVGFDPINDYITIGDNVIISAGVRIIGNLSIGSNTWVGPNTVVTETLPANSVVLGKTITPRPAAHA